MESSSKKISIIFPSYNGEKFLRRNLDSIMGLKNLNEIELVIIENNSSDSSEKIINSYSNSIDINLIKQNKNLGFARACNIGALHAKGEFIFITNQDVVFYPDTFKKLINLYKEIKSDEEIVISPALVFENGTIHYFGAIYHFLGFSYTPEITQPLPLNKIQKLTQRLSGGTLFIKKDLFLEMKGFDGTLFMYYEDTDLSLRLMRRGIKIYTTNDPYVIHQKHDMIMKAFHYFLLERNRFIVYLKNIKINKKFFPFFFLLELVLIFQAIIIKKFPLRVRIYLQLMDHIELLKKIRKKSQQEGPLLSSHYFKRGLDSCLLGELVNNKILNKFLNLFNRFLKVI